MFKEYFKIALRNLKTRQLRSWLTILGIVIGIFLVTSLLSLSGGIKQAIQQELRMMGKNLIMVLPGDITDIRTMMFGGLKLTDDDLKTLKKIQEVESVAPMLYKGATARFKGKKKTVLLYGIPLKESLEMFKEDMGWRLKSGEWPSYGKREVIAGSFVPEEIFPGMKAGEEISIEGRKFKIVGILKSLGNKQDDSMIGMDFNLFKKITGERKGAYMAFVTGKNQFSVDMVAQKIKNRLEETRKRKRGEDAPPFTVLTSEKAGDLVSNIMNIIQIAIFCIASISIIVGGIGIMNTMYTAVRERTREIGVMKAVGAKARDIIFIFLIESGIVGIVGGIGGMILGFSLAKGVELTLQFHPIFYLEASITPGLIIFGLTFSFIVGCIAGAFPAYRASKLEPVEALRYE